MSQTVEEISTPPGKSNIECTSKISISAWWMLFVLFLLYGFSYIDRLLIAMIVPGIKHGLRLSDVEIGVILGPAFAIFYAIFGVPLGWAADRYPRRWVIFLGVNLWSIATAAGGFAQSFWLLFGSRVGVGVGEASLSPAAFNLLADGFPKKRLTLAISIYQTGIKVGGAVAYSLGAVIIAFVTSMGAVTIPGIGVFEPWQTVLILAGVPGLLLAPLVFTFSEPVRRDARVRPGDSASAWAFFWSARKPLLLMAFGFAMVMMAQYSMLSWVPAYMTRQFGWKPEGYGPELSMIGILAAASMIVKAWIVDWLYARGMRDAHLRFYTWILAVSIPISAVCFFISGGKSFLILYAIVQVIAVQFVVYMAATLQIILPVDLRGRISGAFLALVNVVGAMGPFITGMITDYLFKDEGKLGMSIGITVIISFTMSFILLRTALPMILSAVNESRSL